MKWNHLLGRAGFLLALAVCSFPAVAQEFPPRKPVKMVVGFAAGGGADTAARLIAKRLGDSIGQPVVVENRPGAGGNIAHQYVAGAPADGTVILLGSIGPLAIAPHLMKLPYDPVKDLAPITMGLNFPNLLVVDPGLKVRTLSEFIALARERGSALAYASTGAGSASHLAGEMFNQRAGVEIVHVPYKGGAPAMVDLIGGRVAAYFAVPATAAPYIEAGKVVALATTGLTRASSLPTSRPSPNRASRASAPPTGMRSSRPAGHPSRSLTAGTRKSSRC